MAGDQSLILMEKLSKDEALCSWSKVTAGIWGINMQGKSNRRITGSRKHEGQASQLTSIYTVIKRYSAVKLYLTS